MMRRNNPKIKLSIPALACELNNKCSPEIRDIKVNFHYFGGNSLSVATTKLPPWPCEIHVDAHDLKAALNLAIEICDEMDYKKRKKILQECELIDGKIVRKLKSNI